MVREANNSVVYLDIGLLLAFCKSWIAILAVIYRFDLIKLQSVPIRTHFGSSCCEREETKGGGNPS